MNRLSQQSGISLIETLISLSILMLISIAASQALQRASVLNEKIAVKSQQLQTQFSLEQLISRDIINSRNIIWPSQDCASPANCFVLELKHSIADSGANDIRYLRYRVNDRGLYRDQLDTLGHWGEFRVSKIANLCDFSFFKDGRWLRQPMSLHSNSQKAQYQEATANHNPIRAIAIDWQHKDRPPYQQTLVAQ